MECLDPTRPPDRAAAPPGRQLIPYAGLALDRAGVHRDDPEWVAGAMADPRATALPFWRDRCLVAGDPPAPITLSPDALDEADRARLVLLGIEGGVPKFALDLSGLELDDARAATGADDAGDVRELFAELPAADAAILAYGRGLLYWHRHHRYCGRCGSLTERRHAGHLRACTDPGCGALLFPRIEPAVIVRVETTSDPRRVLLARHRASTTGGYSLLAGFVEIGESLEDAVRREIFEEVGVTVGDVSYIGSQPWPFPAGLMLGFRASARDTSVSVDGREVVEARWFTREELRSYAETTGRLGRPDSIDRVILTEWLAQGDASS